jgi:signal-transduction protein with cAMP-binding, CBS, and nucleotidyltransferase domain
MRDEHIAAILVAAENELCGIVTDRDIVVPAIAAAKDTKQTKVGDSCTCTLGVARPATTSSGHIAEPASLRPAFS